MLRRELGTARQQHGALEEILQLAHVARPAVALQEEERVGAQLRRFAPEPVSRGCEEGASERLDLARSLAQRRDAQRHAVQAIEEVLTKTPGAHLVVERAVGGGDEAHVERSRLERARGASSRAPR